MAPAHLSNIDAGLPTTTVSRRVGVRPRQRRCRLLSRRRLTARDRSDVEANQWVSFVLH